MQRNQGNADVKTKVLELDSVPVKSFEYSLKRQQKEVSWFKPSR